MTTQTIRTVRQSRRATGRRRTGPNWGRWIALLAGSAFLGLFAAVGRTDVDPRVAQPERRRAAASCRVPDGFDHWQVIPQIGTLIMVVVLTIVFIARLAAEPRQPGAADGSGHDADRLAGPDHELVAVRGLQPDLLHWPEDWPLIMMSPTVEPFIVFGYVTFYFAPFFPAIWMLRKLQAKRGPDAFVSRHPLISLAGLILVFGFIFDVMLEVSLVRTGLYIYSQAIPFGTLFAGSTFQFPLIWESLSVTL